MLASTEARRSAEPRSGPARRADPPALRRRTTAVRSRARVAAAEGLLRPTGRTHPHAEAAPQHHRGRLPCRNRRHVRDRVMRRSKVDDRHSRVPVVGRGAHDGRHLGEIAPNSRFQASATDAVDDLHTREAGADRTIQECRERCEGFRYGHPVEVNRLEPAGVGGVGHLWRCGCPGSLERHLALAPLLPLRVRHRLQLPFRAHHGQAANSDTVAAAWHHLDHSAVFSETDDGHGGTDGKGHDSMVGPSAAGSNCEWPPH